jgi:7-cyano-7-deazaguanine reductase
MNNKMLLGEKVGISASYDPDILYRVERKENRDQYDLEEGKLPFKGFDVWNCYEVSFLLPNGLPINGVLKLVYSADSQYIVESKSLKLYLNSFNMSKFDSIEDVKGTIKRDLEVLLETKVYLGFFSSRQDLIRVSHFIKESWEDLVSKCSSHFPGIIFEDFKENPSLLRGVNYKNPSTIHFVKTDLLRSNCKITKQPDWGDLFIGIKTQYHIDFSSLLQYIVSFRGENHFHEEIVETIYKRLWDKFEPEELLVYAKYTRRGGIDINPVRWSGKEMDLYMKDFELLKEEFLSEKELRQ